MATIAVLPVLIGLAVDYAIQFQARHDEVRRRERLTSAEAAAAAAAAGGPTIATAGLATAVGFLVLLLSPGADGARLRRARWWSASCWRSCVRRHRRASPRSCASSGRERSVGRAARCFPRVRARARGSAAGGRALGRRAVGCAGRGGSPARARVERAERALAYAVGTPAAGAGGGPGRGGRGLGRGHPERGGLRRARAGAPRPPGAQDVNDAPGGDGGGRARST